MAEAGMTTAVFEICMQRQEVNNRQMVMACMLLPVVDLLCLHANLKHRSSHPSLSHSSELLILWKQCSHICIMDKAIIHCISC